MNISEANAVNTIVRALAGIPDWERKGARIGG